MNLEKLYKMQRQLDERIVKDKCLEGQDLLDKKILALQVELGELANELPEIFKFWSNKKNDYEQALKEYVDGLHFILSIGLEIGVANNVSVGDIYYATEYSSENTDEVVGLFSLIYKNTWNAHADYRFLFIYFISLGISLGFTWDQIEQAYHEKHAINLKRQQEGY